MIPTQNILLQTFIYEHPDHGFDLELLKTVSEQFDLELDGDHGVYHWHRVYKNTLILAEHYNIASQVFMLFALFHDSRRANEGIDPMHGKRGAKYARSLQKSNKILNALSTSDFSLLEYACSSHTKIDRENPLVDERIAQICWDADRLDIGRVGFVVDPTYLSTGYAKEVCMMRRKI